MSRSAAALFCRFYSCLSGRCVFPQPWHQGGLLLRWHYLSHALLSRQSPFICGTLGSRGYTVCKLAALPWNAAQQIVGRERRQRLSQLACAAKGALIRAAASTQPLGGTSTFSGTLIND